MIMGSPEDLWTETMNQEEIPVIVEIAIQQPEDLHLITHIHGHRFLPEIAVR